MQASRILSFLVATALPLAAQSQEFKWLTVVGGGTIFGKGDFKTAPHFGAAGGWWFSEHWGAELRGTNGRIKNSSGTISESQTIYTLTALRRFGSPDAKWQPYLSFGMGATKNGVYGISVVGPTKQVDMRPELNLGIGAQRRFSQSGLLTLDYRLAHSGLRGATYNDHLVTAGLGFTFGERRRSTPASSAASLPVVSTIPAPVAVNPTPAPAPVAPPPPAPAPQVSATAAVTAAQAPAPAPAPPPAKVQLKGAVVYFANGQAVLDEKGQAALDQVAQSLKGQSVTVQLKATGHASKVGPKPFNQRLSVRRAQAVADYLVAQGVPASLLKQEGRGMDEPAAENETRRGRALNRRTEVSVSGNASDVQIQIIAAEPVTRKVVRKPSKKKARKAMTTK